MKAALTSFLLFAISFTPSIEGTPLHQTPNVTNSGASIDLVEQQKSNDHSADGLIVLGLLMVLAFIGLILLSILLYLLRRNVVSNSSEILQLRTVTLQVRGGDQTASHLETTLSDITQHGEETIHHFIHSDSLVDPTECDVLTDLTSDTSLPQINRHRNQRLSAAFGNIKVNIFSSVKKNRHQLLHLAQDYIRETVVEDTIVPSTAAKLNKEGPKVIKVEDIDVQPIFYDSKGFRKDKSQPISRQCTRPKSYLIPQEKDSKLAETNPGMYIQNYVTTKGGKVSFHNTNLLFPDGALLKDVNISIGIIWDKELYPPLSPRETLVSPIVACEPHGLTFQKPVCLSIPHCACDFVKDWDFKLMKSDSVVEGKAQWIEMTQEDYTERKIQERKIDIYVKHFTLYTVIGTPKPAVIARKWVNLIPLAPPIKQNTFFKIKVYCIDDFDDNDVEKLSHMHKATYDKLVQMDDFKAIEFFSDNKNIKIKVREVMEKDSWKIQCAEEEELPFDLVWHSRFPSCTFVLNPTSEKVKEIICTLFGYQVDHEQSGQKMIIAEKEQVDDLDWSNLTLFPSNLKKVLVKLLDPNIPGVTKDWRDIADDLGLVMADITYFADQRGTKHGPTEHVLRKWEEAGKSLEEFVHLMKKLKRFDVVDEIDKFVNNPQDIV